MNLRWPGQATLNSLRNFTQKNIENQINKSVFSEALPNETKSSHTYLPIYVPNNAITNETGGEGEGSL